MKHRSILVTGASRGLGAALARRFAGPGVRLRLVARDAAALAATAAACAARGALAETAALDVRDAAPLAAQLLAWDDAAPFDLAIANAGVTGGTPSGGGLEDWAGADRVLGVNLLGAVNTMAPLLPRFVARRGGRLAFIASVAGFRGLPDSPAYCASKAGLWAYGESLRARLAPEGVGVTVCAPGFFASDMSRRFSGRHPFELSAEAMAERLVQAIEAGRGRAIVPRRMGWPLRLLELLPARWADGATRRFRFTIAD
ncbi:SDR family NAD(P)-dependent oxidoreductase [Roseococcus sp. SYP-B2431]|uniref:SDR family NAD(P)-dependent oxidoreductase n=1 Tax=Roseococcus sp. SYP-B2431 TaxID=2496640 RepID=UPI00103C1AE3|nr:SDR family NAD(P)-dependent oxidoreductase [Roseococcus sp. SYP-B2431]TCH98927.1 SDR family NAD(P)-dependent oxidoreductase [Roseococcus sp. SYP-B2431]